MENTKTLPDKASELIRVALKDLEACEKSEKYHIYMGTWHEPEPTERPCAVCLAGAVMAQSLGAKTSEMYEPVDFDENENKLEALNEFRDGDLAAAFEWLGVEWEGESTVDVARYFDEDSSQFKEDMNNLADKLEAAGY